jgi:nitroreductase
LSKKQEENKMLTTKEAIEKRRSIRKFKSDAVSPEILEELIDAARLAPSGCNAQPWRFKIVTDQVVKDKLAEAAHNQKFIAEAPAVLVCCASLREYADNLVLGIQDLENVHAVEPQVATTINQRASALKALTISQLEPIASFNVAIAIEHIALRALDYGLGSCWVKLVDAEKIRKVFNWDENMQVVALLPIGYPAENPKPRRRKSSNEIII